jgi:hypothetical protein
MKTIIIIGGVIVLFFGFLTPQITQAQGTIYLSNLDQPSTGSLAVGSDSWLALPFVTGNNTDGYVLNSVQLEMTNASGNPIGFMVMFYSFNPNNPIFPGSSLGSLSGSTDPEIGGIYSYTAPSNLTLSPSTEYFIVLTAGTMIASGAYEWSVASTASINENGNWHRGTSGGEGPFAFASIDGSSWSLVMNGLGRLQFAIDATAVPEPGGLSLFVLGGLLLGFGRWKAKAV